MSMQIPSKELCIQWTTSFLVVAFFSVNTLGEIIEGSEHGDNDSFGGGLWRSSLQGTPEDDVIRGRGGNDLIYGRAGNDSLFGGLDGDRLYGEAGNDILNGRYGERDSLYGGPGNDSYEVFDTLDQVREIRGEGRDFVDSTVSYALPRHVEDLRLLPIFGRRGIQIPGAESGAAVLYSIDCSELEPTLRVTCIPAAYTAIGNTEDNHLVGNDGENIILGNAGDDLLFGGQADDRLNGGPGDDILMGFSIDRSWVSLEDDVLTGGPGADLFVIGFSGRSGSAGSVRLFGTGGQTIPTRDEQFPQYLGQGTVMITDFNRAQGDKIEVFGNIADYSIELIINGGQEQANIFWDGSSTPWPGSEGNFRSRHYVGSVLGINREGQLSPSVDFQ